MTRDRRASCVHILSALAILASSAAGLFGCGGGVEVAPPAPVVDGTGLAQATLDGVDLGPTEQVTAIVSGTARRTASVAGEAVMFDATGFLRLANSPLTLDPVVLDGPGGPYVQGSDAASCLADPTTCDFWVEDPNAGVLGRNASAPIPIPVGVPLTATYNYSETLLTVQVSVAYASIGNNISVTIFNLRENATGPLTIPTHVTSRPADGSMAYDARVQTRMLEPTGRQDFGVVDPANPLEVTLVDLSNALNPCIQGHLATAMLDALDPVAPVNLDVTFDDPDC